MPTAFGGEPGIPPSQLELDEPWCRRRRPWPFLLPDSISSSSSRSRRRRPGSWGRRSSLDSHSPITTMIVDHPTKARNITKSQRSSPSPPSRPPSRSSPAGCAATGAIRRATTATLTAMQIWKSTEPIWLVVTLRKGFSVPKALRLRRSDDLSNWTFSSGSSTASIWIRVEKSIPSGLVLSLRTIFLHPSPHSTTSTVSTFEISVREEEVSVPSGLVFTLRFEFFHPSWFSSDSLKRRSSWGEKTVPLGLLVSRLSDFFFPPTGSSDSQGPSGPSTDMQVGEDPPPRASSAPCPRPWCRSSRKTVDEDPPRRARSAPCPCPRCRSSRMTQSRSKTSSRLPHDSSDPSSVVPPPGIDSPSSSSPMWWTASGSRSRRSHRAPSPCRIGSSCSHRSCRRPSPACSAPPKVRASPPWRASPPRSSPPRSIDLLHDVGLPTQSPVRHHAVELDQQDLEEHHHHLVLEDLQEVEQAQTTRHLVEERLHLARRTHPAAFHRHPHALEELELLHILFHIHLFHHGFQAAEFWPAANNFGNLFRVGWGFSHQHVLILPFHPSNTRSRTSLDFLSKPAKTTFWFHHQDFLAWIFHVFHVHVFHGFHVFPRHDHVFSTTRFSFGCKSSNRSPRSEVEVRFQNPLQHLPLKPQRLPDQQHKSWWAPSWHRSS